MDYRKTKPGIDYDNTKMIELTISGIIKTKPGSDEDAVAFADFKMKIPNSPEKFHKTHAMRMFEICAKEDDELKKVPFHGLMKIYVDDFKNIKGQASCVGKDIKEMSWLDLQHLACCLLVREIPFYMKSDLRAARERAYETFMKVCRNKKILKSGLDKKKVEERVRMRHDGEEDFSETMMQEAIYNELKDKCFNMIVDEDNPHNSYNFSRLPSLIAVKKPKESPKDVDNSTEL